MIIYRSFTMVAFRSNDDDITVIVDTNVSPNVSTVATCDKQAFNEIMEDYFWNDEEYYECEPNLLKLLEESHTVTKYFLTHDDWGIEELTEEQAKKEDHVLTLTRGDVQDLAIAHQELASKLNYSLNELSEIQTRFEYLAKSFGLTEEFKENGII